MYRINKTKRMQGILIVTVSFCLLCQSIYAYDAEEILRKRQEKNKLSEPSLSISRLNMHPDALYQAQLAVGYVTTIIIPESPLKIFLGDQQLFKAEIYDEYVAVKPATEWPDARSNLIIFTKYGRLVLEISVGSYETADLVLDFSNLKYKSLEEVVEEAKWKKIRVLEEHYQEKERKLKENIKTQLEKEFKQAVLSRAESYKIDSQKYTDGILIKLYKLSHVGDKTYLQFYIKNNLSAPFSFTGGELRKYKGKGEGKLIQDFDANSEFSAGKGRKMNLVIKRPNVKNKAKVIFQIVGRVEYPVLNYKTEQKASVTFRWRTEK